MPMQLLHDFAGTIAFLDAKLIGKYMQLDCYPILRVAPANHTLQPEFAPCVVVPMPNALAFVYPIRFVIAHFLFAIAALWSINNRAVVAHAQIWMQILLLLYLLKFNNDNQIFVPTSSTMTSARGTRTSLMA